MPHVHHRWQNADMTPKLRDLFISGSQKNSHKGAMLCDLRIETGLMPIQKK